MSSFDFLNYLNQHLHAHAESGGQVAVATLTGGQTNHTARAIFSQPVTTITTVGDSENGEAALTGLCLASVVLKYAPPHMAVDPTRPMSVDRQLVEKKAFELLAGTDPDFPALQALAYGAAARVRVPRLVWHDADAHVLWIEDLGPMPTLRDVLTAPAAHAQEAADMQAVAEGFGAFLAEMFRATVSPPASFAAYIARVSDRTGIYDYLADVVLNYLRNGGIEDAAVLSQRVRTGFNDSDDPDPPKCAGMVDFWPENVLVEWSKEGTAGSARCGLVDWEYFGVSDASSEMGMFLAHLHVYMLNSATTPVAKKRTQDFALAWLRSYVGTHNGATKPTKGFIRRVLLSHGRDLVRAVKLYSDKLDDASKQKLLEGGARSLRAAGESTDDIDVRFLKPSNDGDAGADIKDIWEGLSILISR